MILWDDFVRVLSSIIEIVVIIIEWVIVAIFVIFTVAVIVTLMICEVVRQLSDRIFYNIPMTIKDDIREYFETLKGMFEYTGLT